MNSKKNKYQYNDIIMKEQIQILHIFQKLGYSKYLEKHATSKQWLCAITDLLKTN